MAECMMSPRSGTAGVWFRRAASEGDSVQDGGGIGVRCSGVVHLYRTFEGDDDISRMGERHLARLRARRVATMLQGATRNLLPYTTARRNIEFARVGMSAEEADRAPGVSDLLDRVGLVDQADQVVSTMSGG